MKTITPELSEILGLLCAEGSYIKAYSSYWGRGREKPRYFKNDKSERVEFSNKDIKLLIHFQKLLEKEFNYKTRITKHNKINICTMSIINQILSFTEIGYDKWKVPNVIKSANKNIKICFLRGYFDGDGTISNRIRFFSSNKKGITQVSGLLNDLKIKHTIQGPILRENRKPSFIIQISEKERESFLNMIKPLSKRPDSLRG